MIGATSQDVCATAWHESGHLTVGRRVFGLPVERATIADDASGVVRFEQGPYQRTSPRVRSVISLCGPAAEFLSTGSAYLAPLPLPGSGDDLNLRAAGFDQLTAAEQQELRRHARQLVQDHRRDIDAVARVLMHKRAVDGDTVDALLAAEKGVPMRHPIDNDDPNFITLADGRRVLRDGGRYQVPMQFRDGVHDADVHLHDGHGNYNVVGHRPGFIVSDAISNQQREAAYEEYRRELCDAWRYDADGMLSEGKEAGAVCTVRNHKYRKYFGEPGHLVEEDGDLVCHPDSLDKRARYDGMTFDQVRLNHQRRMRAEYEAYDRELQQRYKTL